MTFLTNADLAPFATIDDAKAEAMITDAEAMAVLVAPCITSTEFSADLGKVAAVKALLRGAILRWHDAGSGAVTQQTAGPFSQTVDQSKARKAMFWPSEIQQLQTLCEDSSRGIFSIDTVGTRVQHSIGCSYRFGASYCSCGADIAGYPLYGV